MPTPTNRRRFITQCAAAATGVLACGIRVAADQPKIRIGQIGTKHGHASGQMSTLRRFSEVFEVVGVVEPDAAQRSRVQKTAAYRGVPFVTEDALLDIDGLQAVAVETDVQQLVPTAQRCANRGLHIFLDKPPGDSLEDFTALVQQLQSTHRVLQMGYLLRHNPSFEFMFRAVREGWIGPVFSIHAEMSKRISRDQRQRYAQFRGGSMFELGCHLLDPIQTVLGTPRSVSSHLLKSRPSEDALADHVVGVLDYDRANAVVRSSLNEANGFARRQFVVFGQNGTIEIRPLESNQVTLTLNEARGGYESGTQTIQHPARGRYDGLWLTFADAIHGKAPLAYDSAHNLAVHKTLLEVCEML